MYLQNYRINNKTALVTGAGKGIGKACAVALAEAGANLIILSRTKSDLDKVKKIILKLKRKCTSYVCDVSNYDELKSVFNKISSLDILVNNAGTNRPEYFTKVKKEDLDYVVGLNIKAAFHVAQMGTKVMLKPKKRKKTSGSIVNISSIMGFVGGEYGHPAYHASKGSVRIFSKAMAVRYGPYGVRVNTVHPGFMPPMTSSNHGIASKRDEYVAQTPLRRTGESIEVAYGVLFLASDEASFVTGTELVIDGGYIAQ